jgi:GNAT superfamily N-acetyltransferase
LTTQIKFSPCKWEEIHPLVENHIRANNIVVESYTESHILESSHCKMMCGDEIAGYFAIHKGSVIWLFNVFEAYSSMAQELFAEVKKYEEVTSAMVATGDEFFLSHCIDNFAKMEKQAYLFSYTDKEIPTERQMPLDLQLADVEKDRDIIDLSGDFFKEEIEKIQRGDCVEHMKIYIVRHGGEVVGFGVIEYGRVLKDIASIGMFVREEYRQKGFAMNILYQLRCIAKARGCRAFSGCWYYNHNSKKSLEAAGAYCKTRLLRFYF